MSKGEYYWCVLVDEEISDEGSIYLHADEVEIHNGDLLFRKGVEGFLVFALSKGNWKGFYAASCLDGAAVAVEHWLGHQSSRVKD